MWEELAGDFMNMQVPLEIYTDGAWERKRGTLDDVFMEEKHTFILHHVPRGKPNYRRQFGKAISQKAMVGVVVEVVREGRW